METDARGCASGLLANPKGRTARPAEGRPPAVVSARCDARRAPRESVRRAHPRDRRLGARRRCSTALVAVTTTTEISGVPDNPAPGAGKGHVPRICGCQDCSSYGLKMKPKRQTCAQTYYGKQSQRPKMVWRVPTQADPHGVLRGFGRSLGGQQKAQEGSILHIPRDRVGPRAQLLIKDSGALSTRRGSDRTVRYPELAPDHRGVPAPTSPARSSVGGNRHRSLFACAAVSAPGKRDREGGDTARWPWNGSHRPRVIAGSRLTTIRGNRAR